MSIIKWDPFRDLLSLQERMNKLFEESLFRSGKDQEDLTVGRWSPSVDVMENEQEIVIKAELPGIELKDVEVLIKENLLTLRGERKFEKEEEKENYHRIERAYGAFQRVFTLPASVEQDKVKAKMKDGILEIRLPKAKKELPKKIEIEVK
ncbi:MAG: Hsp20/alpha crystallin family protein [Nitrospirae bacterium]|nr:Hsp20/alpha crystallin family protein [Nitrospirota bacterium]